MIHMYVMLQREAGNGTGTGTGTVTNSKTGTRSQAACIASTIALVVVVDEHLIFSRMVLAISRKHHGQAREGRGPRYEIPFEKNLGKNNKLTNLH
jgi:hypothetical protein